MSDDDTVEGLYSETLDLVTKLVTELVRLTSADDDPVTVGWALVAEWTSVETHKQYAGAVETFTPEGQAVSMTRGLFQLATEDYGFTIGVDDDDE